MVVSNDVTALAREQLWFGAGRTHSTFGVITVGAGLGIGVVREGHVVERLIDNGHLLTHSPVDGAGPPCSLGHRGCVSAYLSRDDIAARMSLGGDRVTFEELWSDPGRDQSGWFADAAGHSGTWWPRSPARSRPSASSWPVRTWSRSSPHR